MRWPAILLLLLVVLPCAAAAQTITKQPLLQTMRGSELWLQWETDSDPTPGQHFVDWGLASVTENTAASTQTLMVDASHFVHRAALTGLQPGTPYRYRVRSGPSQSPEYVFETAPPIGAPLRVAWIADNQNQAGNPFLDVLNRIAPREIDFIGHAGDTVQNGAVVQEWEDFWAVPLEGAGNLGQTTPVLVARGNHDGEFATAYAYHWLPGNGSYYAETIGPARFLFLDSNNEHRTAAQVQWLEAELMSPASQDAVFRIAVFHRLPYTNLWCDANGYNGDVWTRQNFVPLFEQYGVDLVVSGHAHAYQRGEQNGVTYTVVGGAGGLLDTFVPPAPWDFIDVALSVHHYAIMEVGGGLLRWTAYDLQDDVIDSFELGAPEGIPAAAPVARLALGLLLVSVPALAARRRVR
jgi:predicted phosphodiesterase